jgi:hypothetical protein
VEDIAARRRHNNRLRRLTPTGRIMPRKHAVETHPQREDIERQIIQGKPYRDIAQQFGTSRQAILRYIHNRFSSILQEAQKEQNRKSGEVILNEIDSIRTKLNKLVDAAHRKLEDPNDQSRYSLDAADEEEARDIEKAADMLFKASQSLHKYLDLWAKLTGDIQQGDTYNVNFYQLVEKAHEERNVSDDQGATEKTG